MDELDRRIVSTLQDGLPLCARPYDAAARALGTDEATLIGRIEGLLAHGVLTRFGPMFDVERMGGAFCLCAMAVPPDRLDAISARVNDYPEVAHNYEREHRLNIWFVLATETHERIDEVVAEIEHSTGYRVLAMPKLDEFYVGLRLEA